MWRSLNGFVVAGLLLATACGDGQDISEGESPGSSQSASPTHSASEAGASQSPSPTTDGEGTTTPHLTPTGDLTPEDGTGATAPLTPPDETAPETPAAGSAGEITPTGADETVQGGEQETPDGPDPTEAKEDTPEETSAGTGAEPTPTSENPGEVTDPGSSATPSTETATPMPETPTPNHLYKELGSDTCGAGTTLSAGVYFGTTEAMENSVNPTCSIKGAPGPDANFHVQIPSREFFRVAVISDEFDVVLHRGTECSRYDKTCVAISDDGSEGLESLSYEAALGGEAIDFFVDSAQPEGGKYRMEVSVGDTLIEFVDVVYQEITGDGDALQEPGENWRATVTWANRGRINTSDVHVKVEVASESISFVADQMTLNNMGASGEQTMTLDYRVNPSEEGEKVRVAMEASNHLGEWNASFDIVLGDPSFFKCPETFIGSVMGPGAYKSTLDGSQDNLSGSCHISGAGPETSLEWVAPSTGRFTFDTNGSEVSDTILYAYLDSCAGQEVACNDDNGDVFQSEMTLEANEGQHYIIVVEAFKMEDTGPFQLNIDYYSEPTPTVEPTAYDCADYDLGSAVGSGIWFGPSDGQGDELSGSCVDGVGGEDVSLRWTAPEDGTYTFDTKGSDASDTVIYLKDDGCRPGDLICNDDDYGRLSSVTYSFLAGESIHVVIDEYNQNTIGGGLQLNIIREPDATPTDKPCPDVDLGSELGAPIAQGSLANQLNDHQGSCTHGTTGLDRSFLWTAPSDGIYSFDTIGSQGDTVLYILDGDCHGDEIYCDDDSAGSLLSTITREFYAGQTIVLVVDAYSAPASSNYRLNIYRIGGLTPTPGETPSPPPPPPCPEFDIGSALGDAVFTGELDNNGDHFRGTCTSGSNGDDIAIAWVAPFRGAFSFNTNGSEILDTVVYLFKGGCFGNEVSCDDDDGEGFLSSADLFSEAGEEYIIIVDAYNEDRQGGFILNITGEEIVTPTPTDTPSPTPTPTPIPEDCPQIKLGKELGQPVFVGDLRELGDDFQGVCTQGRGGEDLTFQWEAPFRGSFIFDTIASNILPEGMTDSVIYILRDSCDGDPIGCNDDANALLSAVEVELFKGDEVVVVVDGYSANSSGVFQLNISGEEYEEPTRTPRPPETATPPGCPEIDLGSVVGEAGTSVYEGNLVGAENTTQGSCTYGTTGEDLGFRWVSPYRGTFTFSSSLSETLDGGTEDTVIYLLEGSCSGEELYCNDDDGEGYLSAITVDLEADTELIIVVDGYNASNSAPFALSITGEVYQTPTEPPTPIPTPIPGTCPEYDLGSSMGMGVANVQLLDHEDHYEGSCTFGRGGSDASFIWTAPSSGIYRFDTSGSADLPGGTADTVLYLLDGDCEGQEAACDDDSGTGFLSELVIGLDKGDTVIIVADAYNAESGGVVTINISGEVEETPTPTLPSGPTEPPVDEFACYDEDIGSILGERVFVADNEGHTNDSAAECGGNSGRDIGLLWTAPESGSFTFSTEGSDFDTVLYALLGSCVGTELACSDDYDGPSSSSHSQFTMSGVTAGTQLMVVIDAFGSSDSGEAVLNITKVDDDTIGDGGVDPVPGTHPFFSEYIEGSSFNKAVEIYNNTAQSIDLEGYQLVLGANGTSFGDSELTLELNGLLDPSKVLVVCHPQAESDILSRCDITDETVANYNGNDAIGLLHGVLVVDTVGASGETPDGSGWDVAGITNATANRTLIRKPSVLGGVANWANAVGTSEGTSQWEVHPNNTIEYLGSHPHIDDGMVAITFEVTVPDTGENTVHLTGDIALMGEWSAEAIAMVSQGNDLWRTTLDLPQDTEFAYKYTLGTWEAVEKGSNGEELSDRQGRADGDKTLSDVVANWAMVPSATPTPSPTPTPAEPTVPVDTSCIHHDLGSAVGEAVYIGDNESAEDLTQATCSSGVSGGKELNLLWQAPASGTYLIDAFGTEYDTIMDIREEGCDGLILMCNDDSLEDDDYYQSRVTVSVNEGAHLVIVLDAYDGQSTGAAVVNITPLQ